MNSNKFKIILKGTNKNYIINYIEKIKGDEYAIIRALYQTLISFSIDNGISKKQFFEDLKKWYEAIEEARKDDNDE